MTPRTEVTDASFSSRTLSSASFWLPRPPDFVSHILIVVGLFLVAAAFTASVQVGALLIIVALAGHASRPLHAAWGIPVFLGWGALSMSWSVLPTATLDNGVKLALVSVAAVLLANVISPSEFAANLTFALILICLISLGTAAIAPALAFDAEHALRGIMPHANRLGFVAALTLFNCLILLVGNRRKVIWISLAGIALLTLVLSGSMTSILGLAVALCSCLVVYYIRSGWRETRALRLFGVIGGFGLVSLLVVSNIGSLSVLLGRDPTFTGRTQIWSLMVDLIAERPLIGYGLGAALADGSPLHSLAIQKLGFIAATAHNGPLEVALEVGIIGLAILLPMAVMAITRYVLAPQVDRNSSWSIGACMFFVTINVAEAYLTTAFFWLILCYLWTVPLTSSTGRLLERPRALAIITGKSREFGKEMI